MFERIITIFIMLIAGLIALLFSNIVHGHEAPSGWQYPLYCCSNQDCRQAKPGEVKETSAGYLIASTGEVVGYQDKRVKPSPDGEYHVCQQGGDFDKGRILCLFTPPMSF